VTGSEAGGKCAMERGARGIEAGRCCWREDAAGDDRIGLAPDFFASLRIRST